MTAAQTAAPGNGLRQASAGRARYIGVDLARFLAIAGMIAAHLVAFQATNPYASPFEQGAGEVVDVLTAGIAAPLFALLGGVSTVFATRRMLRDGRTGAAVGSTALRGAILVLLGLVLGMITTPVIVVLAYYGAAMMLVAPLVAARSWLLAVVAVVVGVASGPLNALARLGLGVVQEGGSVTFASFEADPVEAVRALLLTGEYPAVTWCVYLLAGVLVGRMLVSASSHGTLGRAAAITAVAGAATATAAQLVSNRIVDGPGAFGGTPVEGVDAETMRVLLTGSSFGAPFSADPWAQLVATPHSGSAMDLVRTIGIALAVIGLLVALCDRGSSGGRVPRALDAVRAAGAAPLTIYSLHIVSTGLLLAPALEPDGVEIPWWSAGMPAFALQIVCALLIGAVLSAAGRRGPLEALTSGIIRLVVRR